jgi:hypothetical protein
MKIDLLKNYYVYAYSINDDCGNARDCENDREMYVHVDDALELVSYANVVFYLPMLK